MPLPRRPCLPNNIPCASPRAPRQAPGGDCDALQGKVSAYDAPAFWPWLLGESQSENELAPACAWPGLSVRQVTAVRMKLLLKQVVGSLLGADMDYDKVAQLTSGESLAGGLSDTKGAVAALRFILSNSAKYDIEDSTLLLEVQQLGTRRVGLHG